MYVLGWDTESRIIIFYGELKYFPTNALSPCVLLKHNNIMTTQYQIRKTHMHKQKCHYGLWWIKILSNKYTINQKVNEKDELMSREHINKRFILQPPSGFPRYLSLLSINVSFKHFSKNHFIHAYKSTHLTTLNVPIIFICELLL